MPGYSKRDVILIQYPFSDRSNATLSDAERVDDSLRSWLGL
jgi:hypothetical protein